MIMFRITVILILMTNMNLFFFCKRYQIQKTGRWVGDKKMLGRERDVASEGQSR